MVNLPEDSGSDDGSDDAGNPFAGTPFQQMFGGLMGGGPADLSAMFGQLQRMFTPHEGAVDWELVKDLARRAVAATEDRSPDARDLSRVQDVARLAEHWLDQATDMPAAGSTVQVWSRAQWVEASIPAWRQLVEPVAESVVEAMAEAIPAEAKAMAGPMLGMLNQLGGAMFSQQIGQAIGGLSQEVVSASDVGFPVGDDNIPAIVVTNARGFSDGLEVDESDALLYLVLRECAHQRLYARAPWLRAHLFDAIEAYGRGMSIDTSSIEEQVRSLDPSNMEAMQEALTGGMFDLQHSPAQQEALTRLETTLALVEGWVDEVVSQATEASMPAAVALREAVRRRRATGGPAEATFATLVGLELRPRRLRDAAALWGALRASEGAEARDAVWAHPDLLPSAADLDDPLAFAARTREADAVDVESVEFDEALERFLDTESAADPEGYALPSDADPRAPGLDDDSDKPAPRSDDEDDKDKHAPSSDGDV